MSGTGVAAQAILINEKESLRWERAHDILSQEESYVQCVVPPVRPKSGEVFLFHALDASKRNDWRCDQYRWKQNGHKAIPSKDPKIKKYYFIAVTPGGNNSGFQKIVFYLPENRDLFLIQYIGDDSLAVDQPHGNTSAEAARPYIRTCPSVLKQIKSSDPAECPSKFYKKVISMSQCHSTLTPVLNPRNIKQVANHKTIERQRFRVSHDELYNIHEIAYDLTGFISKIVTYPDLIIVCGIPKMLIEIENLLHTDVHSPQLLSYDTTFQLGDIYVSVLLMRHILFQGAPVIPISFLLHERKLEAAHEEFMKYVAVNCPTLANSSNDINIPIVTDEERAICSSIDKWLPGVIRLRCWNHTFSAIRFWLKKHGATSTEIPVYLEDVRSLFHTATLKEYECGLEALKAQWSQPFLDYYMKEIHPDVTTCIARWLLEPLRVYNRYSGVTTNQSEGFNTVLKRLQQWKEAPVDSILFSLYQLQNYYYNEIQRGICQSGNYILCPQFISLARSPESVQLTESILPEDIVTRVRSQELHEPQEMTSCTGMQTLEEPSVNSSTGNSRDTLSSQLARAKLVIAENRLSHDPKLGVFVVKNTEGKSNAITLFPKQSCTCPSTCECYHILAAKLSLGLPCKPEGTTINLSQLRRNTRSRKEKKAGRKRPHTTDCTINLAPDSLFSTDTTECVADTEHSLKEQSEFDNPEDQVKEQISEPGLMCSTEECNDLNGKANSEVLDACRNANLEMVNNGISDREMLRVWKDLSEKYKMDYADDQSHEYIERNTGEILIHVNMDVLIWLQYRRFNNMKELRRDGDYIVATTDDRRDFDGFRDSPFYSQCQDCPIIATPLLFKFMKYKGLPIRTITQFGNVYVTSMPMESTDFDELCEWANDEIDKATASSTEPVDTETGLKEWKNEGNISGTAPECDISSLASQNVRGVQQGSKQRRQKRCQSCSGCLAKDCGKCWACRDKIKFGGPGKLKQCCVDRKCIKIVPGLSTTIATKFKADCTRDANEHMKHSNNAECGDLHDFPLTKRNKIEKIKNDDSEANFESMQPCVDDHERNNRKSDASCSNDQDKSPYVRLAEIWKSKPCYKFAAIIGKYKIHQSSFHTLKQHRYLNDEIVNGYLSMLADTRNKTSCRLDTFVISTQIVTAIINRTNQVTNNLFRKVQFASYNMIIGMYHQVHHWIFVGIDISNRIFYFLDPFGFNKISSSALDHFRDYFDLRRQKGIDDCLKLEGYKITQINSRIQYDGYNCGVITLKLAEQLCVHQRINETEIKSLDLKKTRAAIGVKLLQNSVDISNLCVMCGSADLYDKWVECKQCKCWQHSDCVDRLAVVNWS